MTTEHSTLPWEVEPSHDAMRQRTRYTTWLKRSIDSFSAALGTPEVKLFRIAYKDDVQGCDIGKVNQKADADFIVRAANYHEELRSILGDLLTLWDGNEIASHPSADATELLELFTATRAIIAKIDAVTHA